MKTTKRTCKVRLYFHVVVGQLHLVWLTAILSAMVIEPVVGSLLPTPVHQQTLVHGKVTDAVTGEALEGTSIKARGLDRAVVTNAVGDFTIEVPMGTVLIVSRVGYSTKEVVAGGATLNIVLETDENVLDEVAVLGYQTVTRRDLTGSVATVKMDNLQDIPAASMLEVLAGQVPGMQSVLRTGMPGGASGGLVIRGNTNLSESSDVMGLSNPLYIVDGVPMSLSDLAGFDVTQNDFFATMNPNDFESITVLKDAAATAIYGSRGANGVIVIKTKRGTKGATRFNFSSASGWNFEPSRLPVFIGEAERQEKMRLYNQTIQALFGDKAAVDVRNGLEIEGYMYPAVFTDKYNPAFNGAYDYQDLFYQTGFNQQFNLSMDGGTEKSAFRVGLGYYDEQGVLVGFDFKRITMNASLTNDINKFLHNDLSIMLTSSGRQGGQTDKLRSFPTDPTQLPSSLFYRTPDELNLLSGKLGDTYQSNNSYMLNLNESLRIKLVDGLTWDNRGGLSANFGRRDYFVPSTASNNGLSQGQSLNSQNFVLNGLSLLSYYKTFEDHEFTALLGTEVNMERQYATNLYGQDGPSDYVKVIQNYKVEETSGISDIVKSNLLSYFANVSYGYKNRYKIEGVLRRDGSSRFGANNKWATFPSVKTYWIFSDEPWLESAKSVLNFGKIRLSYGSSGSIDPDPLLQYNSFISTSNIGAGINNIYANRFDIKTYGGVGTLVSDFDKIANRSLSWSQSTESDLGVDLELFNRRLYIIADVYSRHTSGAVYTSVLPQFVGYNSIRSNLVDMISNGWEASFTTYLFPRTSSTQWDFTLNLARNQTVISRLGNGGRDYFGSNYAFVVGQPAFQYYTYEYLGPLQDVNDLPVNPMTGEPMKYYGADAGLALNQQGKIFPGMPLFTDVNGDYQIDGHNYGNDRKIIQGKSPEPKIMGGFQTNFRYNNFSLRIQSSFAFGHYIFNSNLQQMLWSYDDQTLFFTRALYDLSDNVKFWEQPGDDAYYPMRYITYSDGGSARSFRESSMFIERGDYWSIDNVTLSYNLPQRFIQRLRVRGINVYGTMRNVYMWKQSSVPDPRVITKMGYYNGQGYPISRNMVIGLNINI
ncbi:SusC/RagA family TonB-linked outer membrane protein [Parapedobacter soli]|uniref:SusC/RagA family TonB-linked outer membrane protein n=1 Tax=Parapedobacter soli TaxID=416955 RepID=UPI0021C72194|nr:SusC/RagA family TonB-linked outer membrane protein [Parapedobacter soli]